jgi:hypothetical protein
MDTVNYERKIEYSLTIDNGLLCVNSCSSLLISACSGNYIHLDNARSQLWQSWVVDGNWHTYDTQNIVLLGSNPRLPTGNNTVYRGVFVGWWLSGLKHPDL